MNFEERLQKQAERHEALAQSLEMFAADVRQQGENIDKLTVETAAQQQTLASVLTAMQQLIGVVTKHERRIGKLESA